MEKPDPKFMTGTQDTELHGDLWYESLSLALADYGTWLTRIGSSPICFLCIFHPGAAYENGRHLEADPN